MPYKMSHEKLSTIANATANCNRSRTENKYFIKEPDWNNPRDSIAMNSILNERNNAEIYRMQHDMREQAKIDEKRNVQRVQEIKELQLILREKFIQTNEFIRQCEEKQRNADKQIVTETERKHQLEQEIKTITNDLDVLKSFQEQFDKAISDLKPYETVLDQVVDEFELFKSKKDLLDRCDALLLAQVEVAENNTNNLQFISDIQDDMAKTANEANLIIMELDNSLSVIQKNYDNTKATCLKWENVLSSTKCIIIDKEKLRFALLDQIQQLYLLFCKRNGHEPVYDRQQIEEQLDYIKEEIEIMQEIIQLTSDMKMNETKSDIAECGSSKSERKRQ